MTTFMVDIGRECKVWEGTSFDVEAETPEEAVALATQALVDYAVGIDATASVPEARAALESAVDEAINCANFGDTIDSGDWAIQEVAARTPWQGAAAAEGE